jgi:hypothetical protein
MKVVRSSSRIGRLYPQEMFLVLIFSRGSVDPRAMVRSEGNMSLKNPVTPPGIDPCTVRLVAQRLNRYDKPGPNINEYQEYFLGGKGGRCVRLTLPPSWTECLEIWEPQPAGKLRACPGLQWDWFTFTFNFTDKNYAGWRITKTQTQPQHWSRSERFETSRQIW